MSATTTPTPKVDTPYSIEGVVARPSSCALCQMHERNPVLADLWQVRGVATDRDARLLCSAVVIKRRRKALIEFAASWLEHIEAYLTTHDDERLADLATDLRSGQWRLTAETVEQHWHRHRQHAVQPWVSARRAEGLVEALHDRLARQTVASLRLRSVLECLSHYGRMSTEQLARIFYPSASSRTSALSAMERDLSQLAYCHAVYRCHQRRPKGRTHLVVWSLGVVGAELLARDGYSSTLAGHVRERKQLREADLNHDLGLVEALLTLWQRQRDADALPLVPGVSARVTLPPSFVETDRRVTELRAIVPSHSVRGEPQPGMESYVRPDALACFVANLPEGSSAVMGGQRVPLHSTLLPLLLEWDTGAVDLSRVSAQLTDYLLLHATGSIAQRWPQLAEVPALTVGSAKREYHLPLLMVTHSRSLSDVARRHRALSVWRTTRERYAQMTLPPHVARLRPAIIITTATDLAEHGLAAPTLSLWQSDETARTPLLAALANASAPLLAAGTLDPHQPLHRRPEAGRHKLTSRYQAERVGAWCEDREDQEDNNEI